MTSVNTKLLQNVIEIVFIINPFTTKLNIVVFGTISVYNLFIADTLTLADRVSAVGLKLLNGGFESQTILKSD